jgi:peptidyl-prolyl cis-trans isomerase C
MRKATVKTIIAAMLFWSGSLMATEIIVREGELTLSRAEVEFALAGSPKQIRNSVQLDEASRYEFFVTLLVSKKILAELQALDASEDPVAYHQFLFKQLETARELDKQLFQNELALPDFEVLALERYKISKNDIAPVPEIREASHILRLCTESCDEASEAIETLQSLKNRLEQGESFADLAIEFSQDPGSKTRGGRLSQGIERDAENVDQVVRDALFAIPEVGGFSDIVRSRFGFHILKLESITASRTRSFEEVRPALVAEIEKRFRQDAYRERLLSLAPEETIEIDFSVFEALVNEM